MSDPIGHAKQDLLGRGDGSNENNSEDQSCRYICEYTYNPVDEQLSIAQENRTFKGYRAQERRGRCKKRNLGSPYLWAA